MTNEKLLKNYEQRLNAAVNDKGVRLSDVQKNRKSTFLNTGFDYKGRIFEKSLSPVVYNGETRVSILKKMEKSIYFLIEEVKTIKTFVNYAVDKNYKKFN